MIGESTEKKLVQWFHQYVLKFRSDDRQCRQNMDLKYKHILKVRDVIREIAVSEGSEDHQVRLAGIAALFHDIGRFRQYADYGTFSDRKSKNHALLGLRELKKYGVLDLLEHENRFLIETAIANHNRREISGGTSGEALFYSKLLRDADKIDIWRVVTEYYENPEAETNQALQLDLPDTPGYNEAIFRQVEQGQSIRMEDMTTLNDFKLLQAGWVFDLSFTRSFELVKKRRYIERLFAVMPHETPFRKLRGKLLDYLDSKINQGGQP